MVREKYYCGMITARNLQQEVNYKEWRNFNTLIIRAKNLINNGVESGFILDAKCTVNIGSGAVRIVDDYKLDEDAANLIKRLALSYKLGKSYSTRNETAILGLLQKYCVNKGYLHGFQYKLDKFIFDFRCENILIEFDEPHHQNKRQEKTDMEKEKVAVGNDYKLFRFTLQNDIVDIILCIEANLGNKKTIECYCGYIATFESETFKCPDCGRLHHLK
jgi:very-short-patch-repair endonuclease